MYCIKCGKKLDDGVKFCPYCGNPVYVRQKNTEHQSNEFNQANFKQAASSFGRKTGQFVSEFADRMDRYTGGEGHVELKFSDFFTNVFKHHTREEADEIFACGSKTTTPKPEDISKAWPKPWFYSRTFLAMAITFAILFYLWVYFGVETVIPDIMIMGAMLVPISILIFYFECNSPRNISFVSVLEMFFVGGAMSLIFVIFIGFFVPNDVGELGPAMGTGLVEELAKALAICIFIKNMPSKRYILNGILIGGAIGAGFAVFETAGYIFRFALQGNGESLINTSEMMIVIIVRSVLAFGGHVAWAAVTGAAAMIALHGQEFSWSILFRWDFVRIFVLNVILHGLWDATIIPNAIFDLIKDFLLGIIIWIAIGVMLNRGIKEINLITAQKAYKNSNLLIDGMDYRQ